MTIDRPVMKPDPFDYTTFEDAVRESEETPTWLVDGIISAGSTLLYGQAKVGKSFLVSALIASLMSGEDFLGRPVPQDREFSVALCWADDGDRATYARQIREVLPDGVEVKVGFYTMPHMTPDRWEDLHKRVSERGHSLVVIDNLTQVIDGSINSQEDINRFFQGVRRFTRAGIPVVIVGHSSDKVGQNGYAPDKPMGSSAIRGSVRWLCFVQRNGRGNITLTFTGNLAEKHKIVLRHGTGARFEVIDAMDTDRLESEAANRKRQREAKTLDENARMAVWVATNCGGVGVNEAARRLSAAPEFPKLSEASAKKKLQAGGPVRALLTLDPETNKWSLSA